MRETNAKLSHARLSAQKARLVADLIRGLPVDRALDVLSFTTKKAAHIIKKVVSSAIANAEHNQGADIDELKIAKICHARSPIVGMLNSFVFHRLHKDLFESAARPAKSFHFTLDRPRQIQRLIGFLARRKKKVNQSVDGIRSPGPTAQFRFQTLRRVGDFKPISASAGKLEHCAAQRQLPFLNDCNLTAKELYFG